MSASPEDLKIGLIIPCYNEATRLPAQTILDFSRQHPEISILFVNDGSRDNTEQVLQSLISQSNRRMELLALPRNGGKAEAVRQGMLHLAQRQGLDYIGYFDADLSTPLEEIPYMLAMTQYHAPAKVIFGSRVLRGGAHIERSALRHYISRLFVTLRDLLLPLDIYDSQCGAKLVSASIVETLFKEPFISHWIFDVELAARVRLLVSAQEWKQSILEVPLRNWVEVGGSKISWRNCFGVPYELIKVGYLYRNKNHINRIS